MQAMAEAIVNKLLHTPLTKLKKDAAERPDSELPALVRGALRPAHRPHRRDPRRSRRRAANQKKAAK